MLPLPTTSGTDSQGLPLLPGPAFPQRQTPRALAFCIRLEEHTLYLYWPLPGGPQTALVWITKSKLYVQQFPHAALAFLCHNASITSPQPYAPHLLRYWKILNRCHVKMNGAGPWVSRLESEYCSAQLKILNLISKARESKHLLK